MVPRVPATFWPSPAERGTEVKVTQTQVHFLCICLMFLNQASLNSLVCISELEMLRRRGIRTI